MSWIQSISCFNPGEVIAIDGKTLRHSYARGGDKKAIHMVSAWATSQRLVLGQVKVDKKSNEITAIPALLKVLELNGSIVTIDALGCQRSIVKSIVEQEGDYIITLKKNQLSLSARVEELFKQAIRQGFSGFTHTAYSTNKESNHGRSEIRHHLMLSDIKELIDPDNQWEKLHSIGLIESVKIVKEKTTLETCYYLVVYQMMLSHLGESVRSHWGFENSLHWVLDVGFREDNCRIRKDNAPQNFAILRHISLNLLNQEKTSKTGTKNKRLRAGWDDDYLTKILAITVN